MTHDDTQSGRVFTRREALAALGVGGGALAALGAGAAAGPARCWPVR